MNKLWYLAHPYTGDVEGNMKDCIDKQTKLIEKGIFCINPLTHSHYTHEYKNQPYEYWLELDFILIRKCNGIIQGALFFRWTLYISYLNRKTFLP